VVVFSTASRLPGTVAVVPNRKICWALGTLVNGDCEILGAWNSNEGGVTPAEVFGRLYDRGVEYVTYAVGDLPSLQPAFIEAYPRGVELPSIEQVLADALSSVRSADRPAMAHLLRAAVADPAPPETVVSPGISSADWRERYPKILEQWGEAVAVFQPLFALPEPYRRLVRSVDRTAMEVQERLMRAIHRHGPFADASETFAFVAAALQRADRMLERERQARRLARDACPLPSGRIGPISGRALGAPALA
jgi:transposase-like protein